MRFAIGIGPPMASGSSNYHEKEWEGALIDQNAVRLSGQPNEK
jgi:hypothetical protein